MRPAGDLCPSVETAEYGMTYSRQCHDDKCQYLNKWIMVLKLIEINLPLEVMRHSKVSQATGEALKHTAWPPVTGNCLTLGVL